MTYTETFEMPARPEVVFDALVDEKTLVEWLSAHARIECRAGGIFRFWGADVLWCTTERETEGEILELDRPNHLAIRWRWKGYESRVRFRVSEDGNGARLSIEHRFETFAPGSDGPGPDMAGCHWRIAMGNLRSILESGRAALRPRYPDASSVVDDRVELEIEIEAPPERVFRALLEPDQVRRWMQVEAPEIDERDGRYSYGWTRGEPAVEVGPSRIIEIVPNRLLVHDWSWADGVEAQVRWELTPCDVGTRLRLVHVKSNDVTHTLGWSDAMMSIRHLVES